MRNRIATPLIALASTAVLAFGGCALLKQAVQRPAVAFHNLRIKSINFQGLAADVVFGVKNPNSFGVNVNQYTYAFKIGDNTLASSTENAALQIASKGESEFTVPVTIQYADVMNIVSRLREDDRWPFTVEGTVRVGGGLLGQISVPFTYRDTIPRPIPPKVTIERIAVNTLSFTNARFRVTLGIDNAGSFAYALSALTGGIDLNGQRLMALDGVGDNLRVAPGQKQTFTVNADVSAIQLVRGLQTWLDRGTADYHLTGAAHVMNDRLGTLPLNFDQRGTVPIVR